MVLLSWPSVAAEPRSEVLDVLPWVNGMEASESVLRRPCQCISGEVGYA